ncbi:MAG: HupE/UreJ family protein, partial [SAR324 cluster bacterium]|nr:HupE/UreJ family protein [SAR324 cluster bacterium]
NLRELEPNKLKTVFFSVSKKFLNSTDLIFDGKSATLSLRTVNVIDNINLKEPRRSILILEAKYPVNAMNVEWSWYEKFGLNVIRTMDIDGKAFKSVWYRKSPKSPPLNLDGMPGKNFVNRFFNYLGIGFSHIIPKGFDHIIFVLGIFLLSTNWKILLLQVTCFTIAQTLTLAMSLFEIFNLPGRIVEPLIALSIVYIGIENIFTRRLRMWRPILVLLFGLLHGLGFAGALIELGIPMGYYLESLVAFNLGIEAGQILVIGVAYFIYLFFFYKISSYRKYVVIPGSITISTIGIWMFFDRLIS